MIFTDVGGSSGVPAADIALAAAVYHKLEEHYPGHRWAVNADHAAGIVTVQLLYLDRLNTPKGWGFVLLIAKLDGDPTMRSAVRAGGELLERFGLPRTMGPVDAGTVLAARAHGLDVS